jgi:MFS family permease
MQQTVAASLTPYVTSAFQEHSLTTTTSIMSSLIGGIFQLPLAKILDIWGRPQGYALMVFILTLALIMMAACNNVQTYAAAQVFYWVGYVHFHLYGCVFTDS